ncbi:CBS domain-containing protein [Lignipirellula cremea]|uniref:Inosine 5'-monophosphate dehydrogenase n=1 Tax=Lignipirellula cremea TaxID=2528010 RepID=A0A518DPU1_9BACT|nr:CBS domain-containing protein [Lignipirellula cremea]QDU93843.1 inosine 5'-monophosphate dehydrogenase [Lignipirellula cremea]
MFVRDILKVKGSKVYSINPDTMLSDVVDRLVSHNCGSLVVRNEAGDMIGIVTERDILKACAAKVGLLHELSTEKYMSTRLVTGLPDETIAVVMGRMTEKRIRHLPIMENGKLAGMVSIGDIVKAQHQQLSVENHYLKNYIQS